MWIAIRIGVLYAAPIVALLVATGYFVVLLRRARRGALSRAAARRRYAHTLLLPLAVIVVVWATGEFASAFAVGIGHSTWDADASLQFLASLVPLGAYVLIPVLILNAGFWIALRAANGK